ncbi:MAG: hypothetical protein JSV03_01470 [Planctomycetota bacterium]|nr:MAG: hypothetical protein JSV03_01470 [Planctomycetota bacterium]
MPQERNAFKLGITLIVVLVLLLGILYFLAPTGGGDMKLTVRFPHNKFNTVLKPGGEVSCGGLTVGSIRSLELEEAPDKETGQNVLYVLVKIIIDSSIDLKQDCKIIPEGPLLGGSGKLVILDRGSGKSVYPDATIDGETTVTVAALTRMLASQLDPDDEASLMALVHTQLQADNPKSLVGKIHAMLDDFVAVTDSIRNEFDPKQKEVLLTKLHSILDHISDATRLLRNEMDRDIDLAMVDKVHMTLDALNSSLFTVVEMLEENREPLAATFRHIQATSQILEQQIATRIAQQLDPQVPASLMAKVHVAIDRLGRSLRDINDMTAVGREALVLNKEQISRMIVNLKETSDHLKAAGKDIRRNPWRLLYQPTMKEVAQANIFDAARSFSEAATHLDDVVTRLQAVSDAGGPEAILDDQQLAELRDQLKQTFDNFTKAENSLWEQLKIE